VVLWSTQPLTEMSTRSISWGYRRPVRKADNLTPSCAVVTKSGNLNFLDPSGPVQACNGTAFTITFLHTITDYTIFRTNIEREMRSFKIVSRRTTSCIVHCQALCYFASRPQNCQLYYDSVKKTTVHCLWRLSPAFSPSARTKYDIPTIRCK